MILLDSPEKPLVLEDLRHLAAQRTGRSLEQITSEEKAVREKFKDINRYLLRSHPDTYRRYETATVMLQLRYALALR